MGKTISISPASRTEGHAKITIFLDDSDEISDTHFNMKSFRSLEKFLEGTAMEQLPEFTSRVCGIRPRSLELTKPKLQRRAD